MTIDPAENATTIQSTPQPNSGLAIASLILGIVSFIPLVGVMLGIIAIVLGVIALVQIKKGILKGKGLAITGIILGIAGILFTVAVYGSLFYFGFVSKTGPFVEMRLKLMQQTMVQDAGLLELYKKKYGKYPESLKQLSDSGYQPYFDDAYLKPFYYKVSDEGKSYELRSIGQDGIYGTSDDIIFKQ